MDPFTQGYIECAIWSSTDENGNPLDSIEADLSDEAINKMKKDCAKFQDRFADLLQVAYDQENVEYYKSRAGHDFWLTRNHHGAGFWDRDLGKVGDLLTTAAHTFNVCNLYIGDDGLIYVE
jgi:hypothetical protein